MHISKYVSCRFVAALLVILLAGMTAKEGQTASKSKSAADGGARSVPTSVAVGEGTKVAKVNNWTLGIAAGLLEGSLARQAIEWVI